MCGIVGILRKKTQDAVPDTVDALRRLEYRGYDSAGIALIDESGKITRRRAEGKIKNLSAALVDNPLRGSCVIGHIRWATHGAPSERNAHPHATDQVAIVHNGIIENYRALKIEMEKIGHVFHTETDSEVIAHLITERLKQGDAPQTAFDNALDRLEGAFAVAVIMKEAPDLLFGARKGSPLVLGIANEETYLGSDAIALSEFTDRIIYLEEGDRCKLSYDHFEIFDSARNAVERPEKKVTITSGGSDKGEYRHYMLKEIHEQPTVISQTLATYFNASEGGVSLPTLSFDLKNVESVVITGCGTAYYAGLTAKYWIEKLARIPVEIDVASEFRYRKPPVSAKNLAVFVSQSGETADSLAALRYVKSQNCPTVGVVNVPESAIMRECDVWAPTYAGPEIGVASTKAYTCQLAALSAFAIALAHAKGELTAEEVLNHKNHLLEVPRHINTILSDVSVIQEIAGEIAKARDILFLGRGLSYPAAMEGALKLKEISYIHAEGYAAGELKHGPIALIDENVPVIVVAPHDELFEKTLSNMEETAARGAKTVLISTKKGIEAAGSSAWRTMEIPEASDFISPFLSVIPLQLLAYYTAVSKGTDVDQPRNLAKSVTVE